MIERLRAWIAPPVFPGDLDKTGKARLLNTILLALMFLLAFSLPAVLLLWVRLPVHAPPLLSFLVVLVALAALFAMRALARRGRVQAASRLLVLHFSIMVGAFPFLFGAAHELILSGYVLLVMASGLLLSRRMLIFTLVLCSAQTVFLMQLDQLGRLPAPPRLLVNNAWLSFLPMLASAAVFAGWVQENIHGAFERAQQELAERCRVETELRRQNVFFQGFIDALDDPVMAKDEQQRWIILNQSACKLLGLPRADLIDHLETDLLGPEVAAIYAAQDRQVLESGVTTDYEELLLINGEPRFISAKKSRFIDLETGRGFIAASTRDITHRRQMEEDLQRARDALEQQVAVRTAELRETNAKLVEEILERRQLMEELLRSQRENLAFMNAAPGIAYMLREDGRMVRWNRHFVELLGYTDEELGHILALEMIMPEERQGVFESVRHVLDKGEVASMEVHMLAKDGSAHPVFISGARVIAEDGQQYVAGLGIELSSRIAAEEALRESEQRYRTLVEAFPGIIMVYDFSGRLLYGNPSLEALTGMPLAELLAEKIETPLTGPNDRDWMSGAIDELLGSGQPYSEVLESVFFDPIGREHWLSGIIARIQYQGQPALLVIAQDVTERRQAEQALAQSQQRLRALLDATSDVTFLMAPDGSFLAVNEATAQVLGMSAECLMQENNFALLPPELSAARRARVETVLNSGKPLRFEDMGVTGWSDNTIYPVFSPSGEVEALAVFSRDISNRKRTEEALRISEERYALAARGANDMLWDLDLDRRGLYLSPRWHALLGCSSETNQPGADDILSLVHSDDREHLVDRITAHIAGRVPHFEAEFRILHGDGNYRWVLCRGLAVRDESGRAYRAAGSMTDITERKRIEAKLLHDAFHDAATGLPNRALLTERIERAIQTRQDAPGCRFAVLYMDLDRFKDVNDSLGHSFGDALLLAVAQRVNGCLGHGDLLARLGGDEFVILLECIESVAAAEHIAGRIQQALSQPFIVNEIQVVSTASIGIVLSEGGYMRSEEVLRDADIAMYRAKSLGRACQAVFDASMHSQVMSRLRLETDLRQAVAGGSLGGLELHYQPIISLHSGACSGFEALVRWRHPELGLILPADFIPIAEESLLIIALDQWVLREACRQVKVWQETLPGGSALKVNVNLSGKDFTQPDLIDLVKATLRDMDVAPCCLRLEITESAIMENIELASQTLRQLKEMGVQVGIDDFGTGFSSLTYLFQLPVNTLKIDRSFVQQLGIDLRKTEIVQTILNLAHTIGLDVVAEGVETGQQAEHLRRIGCDEGQGFLFSRPMEAGKVEQYLAARAQIL